MCRYYEWVLVWKNHIFTPGSVALAKCLGIPEFQAHILKPGTELECMPGVFLTLEEEMGCAGVALGCCVHLLERYIFLDTPLAGERGSGDLPWSPSLGSMRKFGKRSSSCISENEFHLKSRCCFSVQALYHCTVLILVSWSLCGN